MNAIVERSSVLAEIGPLPGSSETARLGETRGGWEEIVSNVSRYVNAPAQQRNTMQSSVKNLSDLLRLQVGITQYQLRVELVSKLAESAIASMRKLQQSQ